MKKENVTISKTNALILAGDLSGFSFSYNQGNVLLVNEFIKRFYYYVSNILEIAKVTHYKFTGDGFLSVWELQDDMYKNKELAEMVLRLANEMTRFIRISKFDLDIKDNIYLREGITVEPNCIKVSFNNFMKKRAEYIGDMINIAFRLQSLASNYPYICIHKNYYDLISGDDKFCSFKQINIEDSVIDKVFKKIKPDKSKIFISESLSEATIDNLISNFTDYDRKGIPDNEFYKSKVMEKEFLVENAPLKEPTKATIEFGRHLNEFYKKGPVWLKNSHYREWGFIKAMSIKVYNLEKKNQAV